MNQYNLDILHLEDKILSYK